MVKTCLTGKDAELTPFRFTIPGASSVAPEVIEVPKRHEVRNFIGRETLTSQLACRGRNVVVVVIQLRNLEVLVVVRCVQQVSRPCNVLEYN